MILDLFTVLGLLMTLGGIYASKIEQAKSYGRLEEKVETIDSRLVRIENAVIRPTASAGNTQTIP